MYKPYQYSESERPTDPNPRRLIICCDGTWQSSVTDRDNVPSNVTRLARSLAQQAFDEATGTWWQQIIYYDAGVGTGDAGGFRNIEAKRKGGTGDGLNENVIEAYNFIVNNYRQGDEIFCFGFSRGAYTARAVAGLVTQIGIINKANMDFFPELYRVYKKNTDGGPFRETAAYKAYVNDPYRNATQFGIPEPPPVKVVGVWDTVGALGIPDIAGWDMGAKRREHGFHNTGLGPGIQHAFQALALDEHRRPFGPTLWSVDAETKPKNLEQCWFPGVHINIGGGSDDQITGAQGDREQIATITLAWMIDRVWPFLAFDHRALDNIWGEHAALTGDPTHNESSFRRPRSYEKPEPTYLQSVTRYVSSFVWTPPPPPQGEQWPRSHIGYASGPIVDSYTMQYWLTRSTTRTPGQYALQTRTGHSDSDASTTPKSKSWTCETIHPSVWIRQQVLRLKGEPAYDPPALSGFRRDSTENGYVWRNKDTGVTIEEHAIPSIGLERTLVRGLVPDLVSKLDDGNCIQDPNPYTPAVFVESQPSQPSMDPATLFEQTGFVEQPGFVFQGR